MTTRVPIVSVAIPSYNGEEFLAQSISSVLNQTLHDFEVIVTDDGSTDGSLEVVRTFDDDRIRVHPGERIGPESNWNRAISLTTADFVKLLPQDDLLHPECLERQVAVLQTHTDVGLTACQRDIIGPDGGILLRDRGLAGLSGMTEPDRALNAIVRSGTNLIGEGGAVLMRRKALDGAGGFSGKRPYVIDLDLWVRIIRQTGLYAQRQTLASFRVSPNAWTSNLSRVQAEQMRGLISAIRRDHPNSVGAFSFVIGWLKAGLLTPLRRAVYRRASGRKRRP